MKFLEKLRRELRKRPFDAASARSLFLEIHKAEAAGYRIRPGLEYILRRRLTDRLEGMEAA